MADAKPIVIYSPPDYRGAVPHDVTIECGCGGKTTFRGPVRVAVFLAAVSAFRAEHWRCVYPPKPAPEPAPAPPAPDGGATEET